MSTRSLLVDGFLLATCISLVAFQVVIPPFIGLANNGDFPRVLGRFSLRPVDGWQTFAYFQSDYIRDPTFHWVSGIPTSEIGLTATALWVRGVLGMGDRFDIRVIGTLHASLFLAAFYLQLGVIRRMPIVLRLLVAATVLRCFTDVAYVSYFNSFYSDTPAFLGLMLTVVLAARIFTSGPTWVTLVAYTGAAVLLITSKSQHAVTGYVAAALPVWLLLRSQQRVTSALSVLVITSAMIWTVASTPRLYPTPALFNLIFYQIAADSKDPNGDLRELGLDERYDKYVGMHAYMRTSPAMDTRWLEEFASRTSYGKVASFYLSHPGRAFDIILEVIRTEAPGIRPFNFGNYRKADDIRPFTQSRRFSAWSDFRVALFVVWREHIVAWYALLFAGCWFVWKRSPAPEIRRLAVLCAICGLIAVVEFLISSLADACETSRHLFLFHALTDITVCFVVSWLAYRLTAFLLQEGKPIPASLAGPIEGSTAPR